MHNILLVILSLAFFLGSVVQADAEVLNRGTSYDGRSFEEVEGPSGMPRAGASTGKIIIECRRPTPNPVVTFKIQVAYPNPDQNRFKIDSLIGRCDVNSNRAQARVAMSIPKSYVQVVLGWLRLNKSSEESVTLTKTGECKVADKVLTFYLKDNMRGIEVICGNPGNRDESSDSGDVIGDLGSDWLGQSPTLSDIPSIPSLPSSFDSGPDYYDPYAYDNWREDNPEWEDFIDETEIGIEDNSIDYTKEYNNEWNDDYINYDNPTIGEPSDGRGLYGSVTESYDYQDEAEGVYTENSLYVESENQDPISSLLVQSPRLIYSSKKEDSWGQFDSEYSDIPFEELIKLSSFKKFKEYYHGDVSKKEWEDWRRWVFEHKLDNIKIELETEFYDFADVEYYPWYSPYRWWLSFSDWIMEANPFNTKYDI